MSNDYPHDLAGHPAGPPEQPAPRVIAMALKAHLKAAEAAGPPQQRAATGWRLAGALEVLRAAADTAAPTRSKLSDGTIGDARHQTLVSDHNPNSAGVVRALDLTNDPALGLTAAFERIRAAPPRALLGGGYLILNGRITAPDFSHWRAYLGSDPHVSHGHVSVSTDPGRYDDPGPWPVFGIERPPPAPPPPSGFTGPDLTGAGGGLRGEQGNNGPRVAALQAFLNRNYPAYSGLAVDGWWGPRTTGVLEEFAHRSNIPSADGRNIGPKIAAALAAAGFGTLTAPAPAPQAPAPAPPDLAPAGAPMTARDRVRSHIRRRTGR